MMSDKSVLVIDTPESCEECRLMAYEEGCVLIGPVGGHHGGRSEDCPLRPLPEKAAVDESMLGIGFDDFNTIYYLGFNECIDKIIGEKE